MAFSTKVKVTDILPIGNPRDYKVHFAIRNPDGVQPLDAMARSFVEWRRWQEFRPGVTAMNPEGLNPFNRKFILALARIYEGAGQGGPEGDDIWLFGGIFRVVERSRRRYGVTLTEQGDRLVRRLKIRYPLQGRAVRRNLETVLDGFEIAGILSDPFATSVELPTNVAKEIAHALEHADAFAVKRWDEYEGKIPTDPGIYMFSEGNKRLYVGSGTGAGGVRGRLHHQIYPIRIGRYTPENGGWTMENQPPQRVRDARNLLFHVLDDNPRPAPDPPWWNRQDIEALNQGFRRIHGMRVRWAKAPDRDVALRAEHCAIGLLEPRYVAK